MPGSASGSWRNVAEVSSQRYNPPHRKLASEGAAYTLLLVTRLSSRLSTLVHPFAKGIHNRRYDLDALPSIGRETKLATSPAA